MTVYDRNTIDHVTHDEVRGLARLWITVPGPLVADDRHLIEALSAKLNSYVEFIKSGELERQFKALAGVQPGIVLGYRGELDAKALPLVESMAEKVTDLGVHFSVLDLDSTPAGI